MVHVETIFGSINVKAPMRNWGHIIGTPVPVRILDAELIIELPPIVRLFLSDIPIRTMFTPMQLYRLRPRILIECPGYRFAYKEDVASSLRREIYQDSSYELLGTHDHPHDLIGFPPGSFEIIES